MFLLEFVLWIAPGSGLMIYICRLVKSKADASTAGLRQSAVQTEARLEAAQRVAVLAGEGLAESLANTREALEVARGIELVDGKVQELTDYLVSKMRERRLSRRAADGTHGLSCPGRPPRSPAARRETCHDPRALHHRLNGRAHRPVGPAAGGP